MSLQTLHGLKCAILPAKKAHTSTIIWLHGLGDSHAGFEDVFRRFLQQKDGIKVILPNAPPMGVTINNGMVMPSWYDITSFDRLSHQEDTETMWKNSTAIASLVQDEIDQLDGNAEKIILGGFSQGSALSLLTCFGHMEKKLGGLICCSGYWVMRNHLEKSLRYKNGTDMLVWHGKYDQVVPYEFAMEGYKQLEEAYGEGLNIEKHSGDFEHSMSMDEIMQMKQWIEERI